MHEGTFYACRFNNKHSSCGQWVAYSSDIGYYPTDHIQRARQFLHLHEAQVLCQGHKYFDLFRVSVSSEQIPVPQVDNYLIVTKDGRQNEVKAQSMSEAVQLAEDSHGKHSIRSIHGPGEY